jgi:hypothetical protein
MKEIPNERFVQEGMYVNPLTLKSGILVAKTYSPRGYINKEGGDENAWLPDIILCEASKDAPIEVRGRAIIAKSPANHFELIFTPSWNKKEKNKEGFVYLFKNAFIPEEKEGVGNIIVCKYDLSGRNDGNIVSGSISYSGVDCRDITLRGKKNELENMLIVAASNFSSKNYALKFSAPCCATSDKEYKIEISNEEINKFAKAAIDKLSFYPSFL